MVETLDNCSDTVSVDVTDVMTPGDCEGTMTVERTYTLTVSGNTFVTVTVMSWTRLRPFGWRRPWKTSRFPATKLPMDDARPKTVQRGHGRPSTDTVLGNALGNYSVIQTWTAADQCGNEAPCTNRDGGRHRGTCGGASCG